MCVERGERRLLVVRNKTAAAPGDLRRFVSRLPTDPPPFGSNNNIITVYLLAADRGPAGRAGRRAPEGRGRRFIAMVWG